MNVKNSRIGFLTDNGEVTQRQPKNRLERFPHIGTARKVSMFWIGGFLNSPEQTSSVAGMASELDLNIEAPYIEPTARETLMYRIERYEEILKDRMNVLAVGHSQGTITAAILAKRNPGMFAGFIGLAPTPPKHIGIPWASFKRQLRLQYLKAMLSGGRLVISPEDGPFMRDGSDVAFGPEAGWVLFQLTRCKVPSLKSVIPRVEIYTPQDDGILGKMGLPTARYHADDWHLVQGGHYAHTRPRYFKGHWAGIVETLHRWNEEL